MSEPITRDPEGIVIRPTIQLVSQNEIARWYFAAWIGSIIALGILALVAFAAPHSFNRVNDANQETAYVK